MEVIREERRGVLFYACPQIREAGFPHGFSTRIGGVSPPPWDTLNLGGSCGDDGARVSENFRRFCAAIGASPEHLVKNQQVHGDTVRTVTGADAMSFPGEPGTVEADGLLTREPGVCLAVFSADCIPVLLCDPVKRAAAAVHAGWRGTALGIAARGVEALVSQCGSSPGDILAAIGPGISLCCFETHGDVPQGLRAGLGGDAESHIHPIPGTEKYHVDLKGANRTWLLRAGLRPEHIALCPACTACDLETFWSHRRMGTTRGSMAALIEIGAAP